MENGRHKNRTDATGKKCHARGPKKKGGGGGGGGGKKQGGEKALSLERYERGELNCVPKPAVSAKNSVRPKRDSTTNESWENRKGFGQPPKRRIGSRKQIDFVEPKNLLKSTRLAWKVWEKRRRKGGEWQGMCSSNIGGSRFST